MTNVVCSATPDLPLSSPQVTSGPKIRFWTRIVTVGILVSGSATCAAAELPPNIVVLLADDLGYGELSCQNEKTDIPTPHIDRIAQRGVRFTDGYVTAPFCAASRAGLITGRYQTRFGFEFNPIGARNEDPSIGLPPSELTLAEILREHAGYSTALIGKWHLGGTAPFHPLRHGFDEFFGFLHEGHTYVPPPYRGVTTWLRRKALPGGQSGRWQSADGKLIFSTHLGHTEPDYDADNPVLRAGQPVEESAYLTDLLTREAVDFIERCGSERPFFLLVAYNAVHSPMQALEADLGAFKHIADVHRRIFAAMLHRLDLSVGAILDKLQAENLEERTLVVFLSDNGGPTRELTSRNDPFRGEKGTVYEGGLRVPFLMQWPGQIPAGVEFRQPVISLDIFATAVAAAGATHTEPIDGVDLLPYLAGETSGAPHDALFWRVGHRSALRRGDWKILRHAGRDANQPGPWRLYHLSDDLQESRDLAAEAPDKRDELIGLWEQINQEMVDPLWR